MKQISFEELPQILQDRVTGWASVSNEQYEILRCELNNQNDARCFVKSDQIIGIFDKISDLVRCVWLNESELKFLLESLNVTTASNMGKKGGSAKTEAKTNASRENGKKGGRPRKVKEE